MYISVWTFLNVQKEKARHYSEYVKDFYIYTCVASAIGNYDGL